MTLSPGPASFIRGPKSASPSNTRGGSRVPEWGPLGSVRGALSNERPYRDLRNVVANYPFEKSRRFGGIQPNSGHGDHSRLSCSAADTQLGAGFCRDLQQAFCTDVGYAAQSRQATHYLNHLLAAQQNRRQERNAGRAGAEKHDSVDCGSLTALLASFIERDTPWL